MESMKINLQIPEDERHLRVNAGLRIAGLTEAMSDRSTATCRSTETREEFCELARQTKSDHDGRSGKGMLQRPLA
jgi:hypothetical protein